MKKVLILALALLPALTSGAWERSESEMRKCARTQLNLKNSEMKTLIEKDMVSVYGSSEGGYVVVSRSTSTAPVIGYSDNTLDLDNLPDGLQWWLSQADRVLTERENLMPVSYAPFEEVSPMLKTAWEQDSPYNNLCPAVGGFWGGKAQTGCVATAMAQVLKYFQYPPKSEGIGFYSTDGQSYNEVKMSTEYKWDQMLDRYRMGYTEEQAQAVAELMRDCGYATKMVYTSQGSGANLYDGGNGLAHNMAYDSLSLRVRTRIYYTDKQWVDMVHSEIEAKRPILYAATDPARMGHAFVLDGMDSKGFVHVNWGWGGSANGYFDISVLSGLTPSYMDPYVGSEIKYNFCDDQLMVIGLNPSAKPAEGAEYESFFGTYEYPTLKFVDDNLEIESVAVYNFSALNFKGLLGLVVQGENDHAVVLPFFYSAWEDGLTIPVIGGLMLPEEYYASGLLHDTDGATPRPDGKYKLYFVSWAEQEMAGEWEPRLFHFPVPLDPNKETSTVIWEAEIKNGHWVPESLKMNGVSTSEVSEIAGNLEEIEAVYTLDGQKLNGKTLPKGTPVVVRKGDKSSKVIIR